MRLLSCLLLLSLPLSAADLVFPKTAEARRVRGELVGADFVHRSGQFRAEDGTLTAFTLPPFAVMKYRGAEADLRDVPLGTKMDFLLLPGATDRPARLLTTDDGQKPDAAQQQKFREFTEKRGVAGWITKTEAKLVTVQLFSGDPAFFEAAYADLLAKGKTTKTCVANDELRTWNPGVDGESGSIQDVQRLPADGFGFSGWQVTVSVSNMLEGFRRGRVVRLFLQGWKVQDQFYGESLMGYGFGRMQNKDLVENAAREYPEQFPFRTDFGNDHLPWYQLRDDLRPPPFSEHVLLGALVTADAKTGAGEFRAETSGELVPFTLEKKHTLRLMGKDTQFAKLPTGLRYRFHCYQDAQGRFSRVTFISDEFSHLQANATTAKITAIQPGSLHIDWMLPLVKDYNGDMQRPQPFGRCILPVDDRTKIWAGDQALKLADLKPGDEFHLNLTAELPDAPARAAEIWLLPADAGS